MLTETLLSIKGLEQRTTPEFRFALARMAERLDLNASYLAAVIGYETNYLFSASVRNPLSGATGLIQFMPKTAGDLGVTTEELSRLSAIDQLHFVERYLRALAPAIQKFNRPVDYYLAVFYPAKIAESYTSSIFVRPSTGYEQNKGLDRNGDGKITVGDLAMVMDGVIQDSLRRPPIPLADPAETPGNPC